MPTISTLTVDIVANPNRLTRGLKLASAAIIGVGVVATKMALDYDDAFTKISAVSNASAQDIEKWKGQVLEMAGKTAQAPKELADALFFLASAGLKTSQIMPVLEASAKASAAGLGETAEIAKLTANTLNAYAGSGLKASKVTDILVAAVREGSADTDEFGTAIGRILPIASAAGIGFDSVAASLASLSNIGLDVNEGVTAMRGLFQALVSPTSDAAKAMESVGLNAQDLLDSLQEDGLIATIRMLDEAARKNTTTQADYMGVLRALVPNVRSLTGLLGLTTQEAERVDGIFKRVSDSTGSLNKAFGETADSAGFKFRQALALLQVKLIELGSIILPVLATIVVFLMENVGPAVRAIGAWFEEIWGKVQPVVQGIVEWFQKLWNAVKPVVTTVGKELVEAFMQTWRVLQSNLGPMLAALWSLLMKLWELFKPLVIVIGVQLYLAFRVLAEVLPVVIAIITKLIEWLAKIIEGALAVVTFFRDKFVEPIINVFTRLVEWIGDHWRGLWTAMKVVVGAVVGPIVGFIQSIISVVQTLIGWIVKAIDAFRSLGSSVGAPMTASGAPAIVGHGIPPQARGQHGGFVERTGFALIHAGETLVPAGGGGGLTLIINGDVTGEEIVRKVRDGLLRLQARNATTGL